MTKREKECFIAEFKRQVSYLQRRKRDMNFHKYRCSRDELEEISYLKGLIDGFKNAFDSIMVTTTNRRAIDDKLLQWEGEAIREEERFYEASKQRKAGECSKEVG